MNSNISILAAVTLPSIAFFASGCTSYPLHGNLNNDEIRERIGANFHLGMNLTQVQARLAELRVSERYVRVYADAPPRSMLVRLYPPGGPWVSGDDDILNWVDVVFTFDSADTLIAARSRRDSMRYYHGDPVGSTERLGGPLRRDPASLPPPLNPPEGDPIPLTSADKVLPPAPPTPSPGANSELQQSSSHPR